MKTRLIAAAAVTILAAGAFAGMTLPGLAAAKNARPVAQPPAQTVPFVAYGGAFGRYFAPDGSQQWLGRTVAGAAPNIIATGAGVRCEYRYIVQNGQRIKFQYCN
jgi:hypothetical protein